MAFLKVWICCFSSAKYTECLNMKKKILLVRFFFFQSTYLQAIYSSKNHLDYNFSATQNGVKTAIPRKHFKHMTKKGQSNPYNKAPPYLF